MNNTNITRANRIFDRFKNKYPTLANEVVNYYMDGRYMLTLEYENGNAQFWDEFDDIFYPVNVDHNSVTDEQYRIDIGRRIYKVMFMKNITQEMLSEMTGIAQQQLSRYISGRTMPSFRSLDKITRALRMSLDELRHIDVDTEIDHLK